MGKKFCHRFRKMESLEGAEPQKGSEECSHRIIRVLPIYQPARYGRLEWQSCTTDKQGQKKEVCMIIDLSLKNAALYEGCVIEEVAGRLNLTTPVDEAINIVGRNVNKLVASIPAAERDEVELTGPMAVWSYIVVFHAVVHAFSRVTYNDGRSGVVVVAAHG